MSGFLRAAQAAGIVEMVGMHEVKFMRFRKSTKTTLGADGLGGCSVVIIASDHGGIMAHVPPNSAMGDPDPQSYVRHTKKMMDQVEKLYEQNKKYFPTSANYVICAVYHSKVAVPEQKEIMTERIASIAGTSASEVLYVIEDGTSYASNPAKGTVWLDGRSKPPKVYVEDREVSRTTAQASASTTAAQSSPRDIGYWFFRDEDQMYYYCHNNQQVSAPQKVTPLNQWVLNASGWHGTAHQYMRWDGTQAEYR